MVNENVLNVATSHEGISLPLDQEVPSFDGRPLTPQQSQWKEWKLIPKQTQRTHIEKT